MTHSVSKYSRDYGKEDADKYCCKGNLSDASVSGPPQESCCSNSETIYCLMLLFKIGASVHLPMLYTGQHSMPNIDVSCPKNVCNDTFVKIRYLKVKVECVIQGTSILSRVNISLHRLSSYCPRVMAEVFVFEILARK